MAEEKKDGVSQGAIDLIVALAKGQITHREALGIPGEQMVEMAEAGQKLLESESYAEARDVFDGLVALDPNIAYFHQGLGTALFNLNDKAGAQAAFRKSVEIDPQDITGHVNLAMVLVDGDNKDEARKLLEEAKKLDPKERHPMAPMLKRLWVAHFV